MHSARRLAPATAVIAASRSKARETRRAKIATPRRSAEPKVCPPDKLDSPPAVVLAYPAAASVWEARAQSASTARRSTASAASSWQKINS